MVEIVCCSADDCVAAERGGADQVELCAAILAGGLTPSPGLYSAAREACKLPLMVMIRPRGAGFAYSDLDFAQMIADAFYFRDAGADGLVFGVLHENGEIDRERMAKLISIAGHRQKVCHRCFDVTPDPFAALETLVELGFDRVLTSGQRPSVVDNAELVKELIRVADGRIEVLPGAGLRPGNAREFVARTGAKSVHLAPFLSQVDPSTHGKPEIDFGGGSYPANDEYGLIDEEAVRQVVAAVS